MESGMNHLLRNSRYYVLVFLTAWGLKYHYSRADSDGLAWVLAPTAGLVGLVSGIPFESEAHTGFVSQGYRVIIAPACAGIPEYALGKVFDKFFSLQRPDSREKSTGLGLNFVAEVAKLHGGTVRLENRALKGVRATLTLPLQKPKQYPNANHH
jgi:hypothetical protein